ncbi:MAG: hypothetical protein IKG40_01420 [Bacilli bacterium]|nr:hypothetical protein [Bacilli bacterium]
MEVEGVVIDSYFLKSDFTDHEIRLILNTQLFNGRREQIQISKDKFDEVFEQFSTLEECGVGDILDFKGSFIKVVLELFEYDDKGYDYTREVLKTTKIKKFPKDEWIDLQ